MKAFKSKTIWFSMILAVFGVLEMQSELVRQVVGPDKFGAVMLLISAVTAVLRVVTTKAISEK